MGKLRLFDFNGSQIRTVEKDGQQGVELAAMTT